MYPPVGARPPPGFLMSEPAATSAPTLQGSSFDEFAVAIIDENNPFEAVRADKRTDFADFRHGERVSEFVPAGTLDINHFKIFPRVLQAIFKRGKIYGAFGV